jgi:type I restriction enzyme, S subunit
MSEWKETTLAEVINIQNGYAFKSEDFDTQGIPVIKIKNIASGKMLFDDIQFYSKPLTGLDKFIVKENDILIAMTGSHVTQISSAVGKVTRYDSIEKSLLNQRVGKIFSVNTNQLNNNFLYYFLIQPTTQYQLGLKASGSANQANISPSNIKDMPILLPPISEQKQIADVLSCLDAKIENLRRQNETLEAIAQTLFKHWFIDFEFPNADGKPYKSSGGAMVASELGEIPEGWCVTTIEKIANRIAMGPFGSRITTDNFVDSGIPIIRGNNLVNGFNEDSFVYLTPEKADELKSSNVFPEDIVFTHRGTLGQVGFIPTNAKYPRYVVSQSQMFLSVNRLVTSPRFIYRFFSSKIGVDALLANKNTTGVPSIARPSTSLKAIQIVLPENKIMEKFDALITSIDFKKNSNTKQIKTLTKTRDTLLPKLMSGQLRVKE